MQGIKEVTLLGQNVNSYRDVSEVSFSQAETKLSHGFRSIYRNKAGGLRFADLLDQVSQVLMCEDMYVCIYVYICIYSYVCIYMYVYMYIYVYICIYMYVYMYIFIYCIYMYICMSICMCVYVKYVCISVENA